MFSLKLSYAQNITHGFFFSEVLFILAPAALGQEGKAVVHPWGRQGKGRHAKGRTEQSRLLEPGTHLA